jgi:hypothetical protein
MTERNEGIVISGGVVTVGGSMAAGPQARAYTVIKGQPIGDSPEVQELLRALEASLRDHAQELTDSAAALTQLRALSDELKQDEPQGSRLSGLLNGLKDNVGAVASIMTNVAALEHLLVGLF